MNSVCKIKSQGTQKIPMTMQLRLFLSLLVFNIVLSL